MSEHDRSGQRNMRFSSIFALFLLMPTFVLGLEPGDNAPAFELPNIDADGKDPVVLSEYKEKVVYLDFWASWCRPCLDSLPWLSEIYVELKAQGFTVVAVNIDEQVQAGRKFLERYPVAYVVAHDQQGKVSRQYGINIMPTSFLIDRDNKVRLIHEGFKLKDTNLLRKSITRLLAEHKTGG